MTSTRELIDAFISGHREHSDVDLARDLVISAGDLAHRMRAAGISTDFKTSISDVVTDADRAAEEFVAAVLKALRPDDGVLGEEGAQRASQSGKTWVIDPVDGTYNFTSGSDYWCSALALVEGDPSEPSELIVGAVHRPEPATTWVGGAHVATTENDVAVAPLEEKAASTISLGTYLHPTWMSEASVRDAWLGVAGSMASLRMFGAGSVDLAGVASGRLGAWMQHSVADWDWLPGKALVEGAGGRATTVESGGVRWCVAGNPRAVEEIITML